ncbi:MAG: glycosyltransferase family 2 protein, partial [Bacteroidales bacterium]|nr:glycosyltransferase family 2 protein [Bacteroidales bacterium]
MSDSRITLRDRGICVIIPTYNNGGTILDVVSRAMAECQDVIVVCDGCTDNTLEILSGMADKPHILDLKRNQGKGTALKEGFRYALAQGFAYAITLDGDGQHFPEDIPVLLKANQTHPGALIVGERKDLESADRSKGSKFANKFSNFWFAIQTGHYLNDTQTGYRLYPLKKLRGLSLLTSRYEAELELMVFASWHGVKLVSTPVNVYYPPREERVSHFRPGKDFARITILNSVLCILALVYGLPLAIIRGG